MRGTTERNGRQLLRKEFNELSWWSANLETVAHYYEGSVVEITVEIDNKESMSYVTNTVEANEMMDFDSSKYTFGFIEVKYPKDAIWYSFGGNYLSDHIIEIKEIFPDLSAFNE